MSNSEMTPPTMADYRLPRGSARRCTGFRRPLLVLARRLLATVTTRLYSLAPCRLLLAALLPGAEPVRAVFEPFVKLVKTWDLPGWLVDWGDAGNMDMVLFAMGGYGSYLGFRIKLSDDPEEKAKAKVHPKLLAGMFFFALGATCGITAVLTSDKPNFEREIPGWTTHGLLGSGIMTLFLIHAAFGLQLGLSF